MKIDHVALYANDLEGMKDFFVHFFHAKAHSLYHNPTTDFRSYFLTFEGNTRLEIMNSPQVNGEAEPLFRLGFIHLSFSVGGKAQVDKLTKSLGEQGYAIQSGPRTTGDGYYESCIIGPEGNLIEITE